LARKLNFTSIKLGRFNIVRRGWLLTVKNSPHSSAQLEWTQVRLINRIWEQLGTFGEGYQTTMTKPFIKEMKGV